MMIVAVLALTVSVWLTGPTFGADPTMIGRVDTASLTVASL